MPHLIAALFISLSLLILPDNSVYWQDTEQTNHQIVLEFSSLDSSPTEEQLNVLRAIGIRGIAFSEPKLFGDLVTDGFTIVVLSDEIYPLPYQLANYTDSYAQSITAKFSDFQGHYPGKIAGVELFKIPYEQSFTFPSSVQLLIELLPEEIDVPLFYRTAQSTVNSLPNGVSFTLNRIPTDSSAEELITANSYFYPGDDFRNSLVLLDQLFEEKSKLVQSTLFLPAGWFFEMLEKHPETEVVISSYLEGNRISMPLPAVIDSRPEFNWSVIFLFLIWISFILNMRFNPMFGVNVSRYFLNHTFFVIDVMEHRVRNVFTGITILTQHALLTGLFFYVSAEILFSPIGLDALSHHFPYLFISGSELLSLFLLGIALALTLQFISLCWIYLANKKIRHVSQVINLYSWPLHINFLVVTFLVVLNQRGSAEVWMLTLSLIFAVVWFLSFNAAAIDGARALDKFKVLNIVLTAGLHTLIVIILIWTVIYTPQIMEPLKLAISLP